MANFNGNPFLDDLQSTAVPVEDLLGVDFFPDVSQIPARVDTPCSSERGGAPHIDLREEITQMTYQVRQVLNRQRQTDEENERLNATNNAYREELGRAEERNRSNEEEIQRLRGRLSQRSPIPNQPNRTTVADIEETLRLQQSRLDGLERERVSVRRTHIKVSDIKELKLEDLSALTSAHTLDQLFHQVEGCASDDSGRITIAEHKLEHRAKTVLRAAMSETIITSWAQFKELCHSLFDYPVEPVAIVQDINNRFQYAIDEDPRLFVNNMSATLSAVDTANLPNKSSMMKRKLYDGLPSTIKKDLRPYMDDPSIHIKEFLITVERFRRTYLEVNRSVQNVRELTAVGREFNNVSTTTSPPVTGTETSEMAALRAELRQNNELLVRALEGTRRKLKCGYCNWDPSHGPSTCPKNPPKYSCFDCLQLGHKKGESSCPKQQ